MYPNYIVGWAGFNCSYSGKWFGGFAGNVKTKTGVVRDYQTEAINNVLKQVKKMNGVKLLCKPYSMLELPKKSLVYCDPPYSGTTKYQNQFDTALFWQWVKDISRQGHDVYISEYDAPRGFECVWRKEVKSSLSANGRAGGCKTSVEKLFRCVL